MAYFNETYSDNFNIRDYQTYTLECTAQLGVMLTAHTFNTYTIVFVCIYNTLYK